MADPEHSRRPGSLSLSAGASQHYLAEMVCTSSLLSGC